jgi:hypothetical protein
MNRSKERITKRILGLSIKLELRNAFSLSKSFEEARPEK